MKYIKQIFVKILIIIITLHPIKSHALSEVLTFSPPVAEQLMLAPAAGLFVSGMLAAGAVAVAAEVSEPLENYEVGLKWWSASNVILSEYDDYEEGENWLYTYRYYPDTGANFYELHLIHWTNSPENGFEFDTLTWHDDFVFSPDSCNVQHTYPQDSPYPDVHESYWADVKEYYVKRNGNAYFGRPVRVHVYGAYWTPVWPGINVTELRNRFQQQNL